MSRIEALCRRYAASAEIVRTGVEIVAVEEHEGTIFDLAFRRLIAATREDGPGVWDDLAAVAKALRWHLITQPQPTIFNQRLVELSREVRRQAHRLQSAVANQELLADVATAASALALPDRESAVATELLRTCREAGTDTCIVIAANKSAQLSLASWLEKYGIAVMTATDLERNQPDREQAYVVGPPRFFRSSLITAPVTESVSFLLPAWFRDRSIQYSSIAPYAEGAIQVKARQYTVGDAVVPRPKEPVEIEDEDQYLPQPIWDTPKTDNRELTDEDVQAHKILLSGGWAMWLDDGERIRSLDPHQPAGERITYTDIKAVRKGTYLVLRHGTSERGALYKAAYDGLGPRATEIEATQKEWKQRLAQRLRQHGHQQVINDLRAVGIKTAGRVRAWIDPNLIRPQRNQDFELLLKWLEIQVQPTYGNALSLREKLYQVNAEIRRQLEEAVATADLTELESIGHLTLDVKNEGFRGILATRVLAISPHLEMVPRHEARAPFEDQSGRWLE